MKILIPISMSCLLFIGCKEEKKETDTKAMEAQREIETVEKEPGSSFEINPVSHASAVFNWGDHTIYLDPVGGAEAYQDYQAADLILITDIHGDHFDVATLEGLDTSNAKIIAPAAVAEKLPEAFNSQVDVLANGESKERYGITIEAIPMYNLREEAKDFHVKGRGNGYVLSYKGERVYFSGDTEDISEMRSLKNIDKAFICMNLPYTMTVEKAADAVVDFKPKQVHPYHYRGRPDVSDVSRFKELVNKGDS
ncbi:MAG: MBL fold metallo-hydrolase, partial [Flavobacteriaceae bacterium]|nr:MBL fold metallo-hydrolase [Flavobacteriaceae bacterium]